MCPLHYWRSRNQPWNNGQSLCVQKHHLTIPSTVNSNICSCHNTIILTNTSPRTWLWCGSLKNRRMAMKTFEKSVWICVLVIENVHHEVEIWSQEEGNCDRGSSITDQLAEVQRRLHATCRPHWLLPWAQTMTIKCSEGLHKRRIPYSAPRATHSLLTLPSSFQSQSRAVCWAHF